MKKQQKEFKYQCGCGCVCPKYKMVTVRASEDGSRIQRLRCKEHRHLDIAEVVCRVTICDKCGAEVLFAKWGGVPPSFCEDCRPNEKKKQMRNYARELKKLKGQRPKTMKTTPVPKKQENGDPDRWMCVHWDGKCYDQAIKQNLSTRPCLGCKEFEAQAQEIDPLENKYVKAASTRKSGYSRRR